VQAFKLTRAMLTLEEDAADALAMPLGSLPCDRPTWVEPEVVGTPAAAEDVGGAGVAHAGCESESISLSSGTDEPACCTFPTFSNPLPTFDRHGRGTSAL
jgi:hypothetical protein